MRGAIEQLEQLTVATRDGDLISKQERDLLVKNGLAQRSAGFNVITEKGLQYLVDLNILKDAPQPGIVEVKNHRSLVGERRPLVLRASVFFNDPSERDLIVAFDDGDNWQRVTREELEVLENSIRRISQEEEAREILGLK